MKYPDPKASLIIVFFIAVIGVSIFGLRACHQTAWERLLLGPYDGLPFTETITNTPTSSLSIPSQGRLEIHELPSEIGPVLLFRLKNGNVQWTRLLVPEKRLADGTIQQAWLRNLHLEKIQSSREGYKLHLICDWEWGGKEAGLIYLDENYAFKNFSLSW